MDQSTYDSECQEITCVIPINAFIGSDLYLFVLARTCEA